MLPTEVLIKSCLLCGDHILLKKQFFSTYCSSDTLMLERFFETELNRLNAFVKTATDALMLYIKSRENVLKRFTEQVNFCWLYFALRLCFMLDESA